MAWRGAVGCDAAWRGVTGRGVAWCGVVLCGLCGVVVVCGVTVKSSLLDGRSRGQCSGSLLGLWFSHFQGACTRAIRPALCKYSYW